MRMIVAGSRNFYDYKLLEKTLIELINNFAYDGKISDYMGILTLEIVSGNARGADSLGERFSDKHGIDLKLFKADWDKYGKSAGYKRNEEMANYAKNDDGALVAFWDGQSKGTKHMIDIGKKCELDVRVIRF